MSDAPIDHGRLLKLTDVAEILNVAESQVYAWVRNGELTGVKLGAKGVWRVGENTVNAYIADAYQRTAEFVKKNPLVVKEGQPVEESTTE